MNVQESRKLIASLKERGYDFYGNRLMTAQQAGKEGLTLPIKTKSRSKHLKTGWIDDTRNIKNKEEKLDPFIKLIMLQLKVEVWPEFYFSTERLWRFDYCLPDHMLYIEVEGGIHSGGRHTRGKGFEADMEKYNTAASKGWRMIRVVPSQLISESTIELIKRTLFLV
jgi:hypothetical protein